MKKACIFCASSERIDRLYIDEATRLGERLAQEGWGIVYGGGGVGLMGAVANGSLSKGGSVTGVIPRFMVEVEWQHKGVKDMILTETMSERKQLMLKMSDAVIVLPGSTGTMDELFEAASDKKLGLLPKPIALLNTNHFFDHTIAQLDLMVEQGFMTRKHADVVTPADTIDQVMQIICRTDEERIRLEDAQVKK